MSTPWYLHPEALALISRIDPAHCHPARQVRVVGPDYMAWAGPGSMGEELSKLQQSILADQLGIDMDRWTRDDMIRLMDAVHLAVSPQDIHCAILGSPARAPIHDHDSNPAIWPNIVANLLHRIDREAA